MNTIHLPENIRYMEFQCKYSMPMKADFQNGWMNGQMICNLKKAFQLCVETRNVEESLHYSQENQPLPKCQNYTAEFLPKSIQLHPKLSLSLFLFPLPTSSSLPPSSVSFSFSLAFCPPNTCSWVSCSQWLHYHKLSSTILCKANYKVDQTKAQRSSPTVFEIIFTLLHQACFHVFAIQKHPFMCVCFRKTVFHILATERHPFTCTPAKQHLT